LQQQTTTTMMMMMMPRGGRASAHAHTFLSRSTQNSM
jgi:hypothetical protein